MKAQKIIFESGNELAAYSAKQIGYHLMGYYPITPSTQIAEYLDQMKAAGEHGIAMIPAEGEHSAAGICYGGAVAGGRVFNATSANGLLYALEQLPVQSGTRYPMVLNVATRTVSGPLCIKGDHSDIMYTLNSGWLIFFASDPQAVYDLNICALKIAEKVMLPAIVAFDGFFTSHQKRNCHVFAEDRDVQDFLGSYQPPYTALDMEKPVSVGCYMNEPDIINNKYQLHVAMEEARAVAAAVFQEYEALSGRQYSAACGYHCEDADTVLFLLGSSYPTAIAAVDKLRAAGKKVGVATANLLRPFPAEEIWALLKHAKCIIVGDRQDSYGANGGNMTLEIKALLQAHQCATPVLGRVYGLGGRDFYVQDAITLFSLGEEEHPRPFDYYGHTPGWTDKNRRPYFAPLLRDDTSLSLWRINEEDDHYMVKGASVKDTTAMPKRLAPGHGACPGCGIPVNVNLLLRGIEGNVVLLFQTGCGMVVNTPYPKTAFKVPYVHNLFQNGAATLSGLVEVFHQRQKRGEYPAGEITFIMVSGDGGMDIGMGAAIGAALRNHHLILFEYDNGGYMNTGYQLSYSTPKGAKSSTSHVGKTQYGKSFFHKDTPQIMAATHMPYVATVAESHPADFIKKAAKAQRYARDWGAVYVKCLSACPLNWNDQPNLERAVIQGAVEACYFPLYEVERGKTRISYDPEAKGKKMTAGDWLKMMGRTKHLLQPDYAEVLEEIQREIDRRWERLKALSEHPLL